ncbi:Xylose isomerase-like TIM barrel [Rubripirellula obstinata]|uniref:Xylose isomerase-like TIM barrel n=1 Tax=Rubripirellula obstinata TaxID=406547 RepID=A0A5B1CMV9_9BACT|nr:sugar phosphate isomerase/epimerase family protein [Rubripirellula obstinata]KAA1261896.1 Xylose isomerase-like TIM barrel [Rubripirellula obstinata]
MAELKIAVRIDAMNLPMRQSLEMAARMGASAVELNAKNGINPSSLSDTGLRSFRKMLDDLNLRVAALRFPTRHGYDHVPDLDRRVDATKQMMLLAYRLGSPVVVNSLGRVPESTDDARYETLKAVVDDLGRYGAKVGTFFAAETGTESGEQLMTLLESSEDGYVAVALNPGQLIINQFELSSSVAAVSSRVQLVLAIDGVLDLSAGRGISVPLGQGIAELPELLGVLEEHQYRGHFVVGRAESNLEELNQGIQYLRQL